jgi:Protein of unknown function (DUF3352)
MRLRRHFVSALACLMLCAFAPARIHAETPTSVLSLIPAEADLLFEIRSPRKIHDLLQQWEALKELQKFPNAREFLTSTQARRFFQLLAYYEKELGASYPDLVDRLTSGGVAVGVKFGPNPAPLLLAIQGKDEKLTAEISKIALKVLEEELQRQESKERPQTTTYQNVKVVNVGKEFHLATLGSVILIANHDKALQRGIDLYKGKSKGSLADSPSVKEAFNVLPKDPLARFWLNMETVRKGPGGAEAFKTPREPIQTIFFGNYFDVLGRTPSLCGALAMTPAGFLTTIRVPRGREGMGPELGLHMPLDPKQTGTKPLLEPKGVLYSDSNYLDLARIWEDRSKLFGKDAIKAMEDFDKDSSRIPFVKVQLSKMLTEAGSYHRFVAVNQPKGGYTKQPKTTVPAFAIVLEMRDPDAFTKTVDPVLRSAAFFVGGQASLKLVEEKYKDCNLVGYRFPEDKPLRADVNDTRFGYSPCFFNVGNQFVASSTIELGRELIDILQAEAKAPGKPEVATSRVRTYATGVAEILQLFEDQLVTQAILDQAVPANEAREQVKAFIELVRRQGSLGYQVVFTEKEFHFDILIKGEKAARTK